MGTNKLKRMNRFELLELMYRLVKENEELRRRCEKLEGRSNMAQREKTAYPAPHAATDTWVNEDEHFRTRREEVMQRLMEQTIQPQPRKPDRPAAAVKDSEPMKKKPAVRQAVQPQPVKAVVSEQAKEEPVRNQPAPQPKARPSPSENLDLDSILSEYLSDISSDRSGGGL